MNGSVATLDAGNGINGTRRNGKNGLKKHPSVVESEDP